MYFFCKYIHIIHENRLGLGPNTNRHVDAQKCLHCAGIEPVTSCVVGEYSHQYATSAVTML
jgi:hypothetical protein